MRGPAKSAPPVAVWCALLLLFVTNVVTLLALTRLNMRFDQLQGDCSAELRERDLLLKTAVAEADKTDKTIEVCHNATRRAGVQGSAWLTIAVEASAAQQAKAQLRGILSNVMFEAPMRSMAGGEVRLFNVAGGTKDTMDALDQVNGVAAWREHGRLSTLAPRPDLEQGDASRAVLPPDAIPGATAADSKEQERTVKFASMLAQLDSTCQHVLFLELGSGATLCPSALHLIRNTLARADSFWGTWSAIRFSHAVNGLVMPCSHLSALSHFLFSARKAAALPSLIDVWLSKDVAKFTVLLPFQSSLAPGSCCLLNPASYACCLLIPIACCLPNPNSRCLSRALLGQDMWARARGMLPDVRRV
eukprot:Tamp_09743.p1 GENE.Tamp_09743~~Tamp_09743.p1  ORF type:complete len:361 (+),score=71.05 Tamp_09743:38-1120(+)